MELVYPCCGIVCWVNGPLIWWRHGNYAHWLVECCRVSTGIDAISTIALRCRNWGRHNSLIANFHVMNAERCKLYRMKNLILKEHHLSSSYVLHHWSTLHLQCLRLLSNTFKSGLGLHALQTVPIIISLVSLVGQSDDEIEQNVGLQHFALLLLMLWRWGLYVGPVKNLQTPRIDRHLSWSVNRRTV